MFLCSTVFSPSLPIFGLQLVRQLKQLQSPLLLDTDPQSAFGFGLTRSNRNLLLNGDDTGEDHVMVVGASAHRTVPVARDERFFKTGRQLFKHPLLSNSRRDRPTYSLQTRQFSSRGNRRNSWTFVAIGFWFPCGHSKNQPNVIRGCWRVFVSSPVRPR